MALSFSDSHIQKPLLHRVLARKYRPIVFKDLIGQESCIQILTNSIDMNRLPHAILLTGIRGIGKTTIARIIARALNCIGIDGQGKPTAFPCGICEPCVAITEDRYIDVIEMDAASRTGVEDVREVIEGGRYKAVSARYKVYIIDEVHMLSKNAFNAFLKTLEEPPPHLIFIFATTELNKVPETIQSRCMRLPLKRIELNTLVDYLKDITQREGMRIDQGAVTLIARAADGSVRDGLSLLDQAMALCEGNVDESSVLKMLGLSNRGLLFNLYIALIQGQSQEVLQFFDQMYLNGSDPLMILHDLMDLTHWLSLQKMSISSQPYPGLNASHTQNIALLIEKLSFPTLSRCWQILLKGTQEVTLAPSTKQAVEIVLLRLCHVAALPTVDDVIQHLSENHDTVSDIEIESEKSQMIVLENIPSQTTAQPHLQAKVSSVSKEQTTDMVSLNSEKKSKKEKVDVMPLLASNDVAKDNLEQKSSLITTAEVMSASDGDIKKSSPSTETFSLFDTSVPLNNSILEAVQSETQLSPFDPASSEALSQTLNSDDTTLDLKEVSDLLNLLHDKKEVVLKNHLETDCKITLDKQNSKRIELYLMPSLPKDKIKTIAPDLKKFLKTWTKMDWVVSIGEDSETPTIREQFQSKKAKKRTQLLEQPLVQATLVAFPEAEIDDVEDHP